MHAIARQRLLTDPLPTPGWAANLTQRNAPRRSFPPDELFVLGLDFDHHSLAVQGAAILPSKSCGAKARKSFTLNFLRAAQMNRVMNLASCPASDGTVVNNFPVFSRRKRHEFHVGKDHFLDDAPRLGRMERRLERRAG